MNDIIVMGCGGNGWDIWSILRDCGLNFGGYLDDVDRDIDVIGGLDMVGKLGDSYKFKDSRFICSIGSPNSYLKRESIIKNSGIDSERFATVYHPKASVSKFARIGRGVVLWPGVVVSAGAVIEDHVLVLSNSVISHGVKVGRYSCVASGAVVCGDVSIGESCYIGANSSIIGGISIGEGALVGMGSVVLRDVRDGERVAGNPAREI